MQLINKTIQRGFLVWIKWEEVQENLSLTVFKIKNWQLFTSQTESYPSVVNISNSSGRLAWVR